MKFHQNTSPLLLLQSEDDLRWPPEQSETLFAILCSHLGVTQMVRYPGDRISSPGSGVRTGAWTAASHRGVVPRYL